MSRWMLTAVVVVVAVAAIFGQSCGTANQSESEGIARDYVKNCPTFEYDGMEETLELVETEELEGTDSWRFTYEFDSRHAGYGDRTGQVLAQVITPHEAVITVQESEVVSAVMDGKWDMMAQEMLPEGG